MAAKTKAKMPGIGAPGGGGFGLGVWFVPIGLRLV